MGVTLRSVLIQLLVVLLALGLWGCAQSSVEETRELLSVREAAAVAYSDNRCDDALRLYGQLVQELPEYPHAWLRIGNCHAKSKRLSQAVVAYQTALQFNPKDRKAWYNLAYVQAQILGLTVAEMQTQVDSTDPAAQRIRQLAIDVLAPFGQQLPPPQDDEAAAAP